MATERIWVWKHLLYPCLGSYLSNLDRMCSFLTCPLPPCGPVSAPALFLESSRQQRAAGRKRLSLSCHGFWPSPPRQSQGFPCHTQSEQSCDTISKSTDRGELPQLGRLRADWHARLWCKEDTKYGFDCK